MKRIIIAMNDRHQSQKLAIVLSHSYDAVIVDSPVKLRSCLMNQKTSFFAIIFEESEDTAYGTEVDNLQKSGILNCPVIQVTRNDLNANSQRIILHKPFGVQELLKTFSNLEKAANSSTTAIA